MIVSYECLRQFVDIDKLDWGEVVRTLSSIGLEVEREFSVSVPRNVVVGKVLKKTQHPNADKLNLCEVDIGSEVLEIVCGARNVAVNQYVAVAKIGALLPFGKETKDTKKITETKKQDSKDSKNSQNLDSKGKQDSKTIIESKNIESTNQDSDSKVSKEHKANIESTHTIAPIHHNMTGELGGINTKDSNNLQNLDSKDTQDSIKITESKNIDSKENYTNTESNSTDSKENIESKNANKDASPFATQKAQHDDTTFPPLHNNISGGQGGGNMEKPVNLADKSKKDSIEQKTIIESNFQDSTDSNNSQNLDSKDSAIDASPFASQIAQHDDTLISRQSKGVEKYPKDSNNLQNLDSKDTQDSKTITESKNIESNSKDSKKSHANTESNSQDSKKLTKSKSLDSTDSNNSQNLDSKDSTDSKKNTDSKNPKDSKPQTTITKSEIRGITSHGMLCSSVELGLPKLNDGIMILDSSIGELILGRELKDYAVFNQPCLELGITPNRGDCLSVLGVARDIASMFNLIIKNISNIEPSVALGVGRFLSVMPKGELHASLLYRIVEIKEGFTPLYIALTLGIIEKYKDDVVANFLCYTTFMTGVLFNAYPLNSKAISPNAKDARLIIQNDENGLESVYADSINESGANALNKLNEIGVNTYNMQKYDYPLTLILEASFINAEYIANKLCALNIAKNADVVHKSTRGSNPDLELGMNFLCKNLNALKINLYSGAQEIIRDVEITNIHMTFAYISECIGNFIPKDEIARILKRLNFRIQATCDENFFIAQPPIYRNDIKNRQDVTEEILRFFGIDNVSAKNHSVEQIPQITPALKRHNALKELRYKATGQGFVECVHYVFDSSKVLKELGFEVLEDSKRLLNPITSELDTLRPSLMPHILESMQRNKRYGFDAMRLFEIGVVYDKERKAHLSAAFVMNDFLKPPSFPNPKGVRLDFYNFAEVIARILGAFECVNVSSSFVTDRLIHPYQNGKILRNGNILGVISKLHPEIATKYDLDSVFFCEIDVELLLKQSEKMASNVSKFQANRRDLTILINKNISFNSVKNEIENLHLDIIKAFFPLDVFHENDTTNALSIRFILQSLDSTLTESTMQETLQKILNVLESKFSAHLKM